MVRFFVWFAPKRPLQMVISYICLCSLFHMEQDAVAAPLTSTWS